MHVGRQFVQIEVRRQYEGEPGNDGGLVEWEVLNKRYPMPECLDQLSSFVHMLVDSVVRALMQETPQANPDLVTSIQIVPTGDEQTTAATERQSDMESSITFEPAANAIESDFGSSVVVYPVAEPVLANHSLSAPPEIGIIEDVTGRVAEGELTVQKQTTERTLQPEVYVVLRQEALEKAQRHADEDRSRETGGVLLGRFIAQDGRLYVVVTGIVRALRAVGGAASVEFTSEAWAEIWRRIDADPDYSDESLWDVIGWYHTHPGFGIFLSGMDLSIHRGHFAQPGHIALVIDPVRGDWGVFCWDRRRNGVMRCPEGQHKVLKDCLLIESLSETLGVRLATLPVSEIVSRPTPAPKLEDHTEAAREVALMQKATGEIASPKPDMTRKTEVSGETDAAIDATPHAMQSSSSSDENGRSGDEEKPGPERCAE